MSSAYLVAHFEIVDGRPVFLGTGVYSSPAVSLTCAIGRDRFACDVLAGRGESFEQAGHNLIETARSPHSVYQWALDALTGRDACWLEAQ